MRHYGGGIMQNTATQFRTLRQKSQRGKVSCQERQDTNGRRTTVKMKRTENNQQGVCFKMFQNTQWPGM